MAEITDEAVAAILRRHLKLYRWRKPAYQAEMLRRLAELWDESCTRVLDLGGGTGVMAETVKALFPVERVLAVDVHDRFVDGLSIETLAYDGARLPFADGGFDCAMVNNVIHHIPKDQRVAVLSEAVRVAGGGPLFIKDHLAASRLDHLRLVGLDMMGNLPFDGMIQADYLEQADWDELAAGIGYRIERTLSGRYRGWPLAIAFPNRLEISMKWVRA